MRRASEQQQQQFKTWSWTYYASATALAAPPKDLGESGAAVRIYTGQEWPIFKVIFDPFPPAPASWPLNILFSSFSRVRSFKPRRKIPIRTVFITCQKTPKCASRESSFFLSSSSSFHTCFRVLSRSPIVIKIGRHILLLLSYALNDCIFYFFGKMGFFKKKKKKKKK